MSGRLWTLCVGVNDYGSQIEFPNLTTAVNDACAVHGMLAQEFGGEGVLLASRREITGGPYAAATDDAVAPGSRSDVLEQIDTLSTRMSDEDTLVFFYAGHGSPREPGYLVPYGGAHGQVSTYLMYRTLYGALRSVPCARIWLFLNCCYPAGTEALDGVAASAVRRGAAYLVAAGRPDEQVLDRVPGVGGDALSPFTTSLIEVLNGVPPGAELGPDRLAELVRDSMATLLAQVPDVAPSTVVSGPLAELRSGGDAGGLRRFGFSIAMPRRLSCVVGEDLHVTLVLTGSVLPEDVRWSLESADPFLEPEESRSAGYDRWRLRFDLAGSYRFDVRVEDPVSGHVIIRRIVIDVETAIERLFRLEPSPLGVWRRGKLEQARLGIEGGRAPFTAIVGGLPSEARARVEGDEIRFTGEFAEPPLAGTARSDGGGPVAFPLEIRVSDSSGASFVEPRRLVIVGTDYQEIPAGAGPIGFPDTDDGRNAVAAFLQERQDGPERSKASRELERAKHFSPPGQASTRRFWLRRYPVTNVAWREFVRASSRQDVPPSWTEPAPQYFTDDQATLPVVGISYEAICEYLSWRGTRLMTAREWERATRGETGNLFPWGNDFRPTHCNTRESGHQGLVSVDRHDHAESPYGVRDLVGNAAEWVDQRLWVGTGRRLMQPFRGGSFRDSCVQALAFSISEGASVTYGLARDQRWTGRTALSWVGFRDVLDEDADPAPDERQALVHIPERVVVDRGEVIDVPAFSMARYAVSNAEYLEFVRSTGHRWPSHWSAGSDTPFAYLDRHLPVTHVSPRDALGFCLWLSRARRKTIRLPSVAQWRSAALGDGRPFPWGDSARETYCNTLRSGFGRTIAVHGLPEGRSQEGVHQLVGNVCEWLDTGELVGGGWREELQELRDANYTQRLDPRVVRRTEGRVDDVGFRYIALNPLPRPVSP